MLFMNFTSAAIRIKCFEKILHHFLDMQCSYFDVEISSKIIMITFTVQTLDDN